uniref:Uncharacterized protein n=1 Tax=viral metagenome TaxID=1070528 RepID=A0A6C0KRY5_9ZZZZ
MIFINGINRELLTMEYFRKVGRWCTGWGCTRKKHLNHIKFSTLRNQYTNENLKSEKAQPSFIANGSYGFTFKNYTDPKKVIKVYFNPNVNDVKTKVNKAKNIANITGNNNQRIQIINDLTYNDLPTNIPEKVRRRLIYHSPILPAIRMPHLGIDFHEAIMNYDNRIILRGLPISTLIIQCRKLIKQINEMRKKQFCHGDITIVNTMIHPETGKMTLIDFDLFSDFALLFNFYYSVINDNIIRKVEISQYIPPEFICINIQMENSREDIDTLYKRYCNNENMLFFLKLIGKNNEKEAKEYFKESFQSNMEYISSLFDSMTKLSNKNEINKMISKNIMNYFDYFRFGMTMTIFFSSLYSMNKNNNSIDPINKAFHNMRMLLIRMCDFSIIKRPDPAKVLEEMINITSTISNTNGGRRTRKQMLRLYK